MTDPTTSWITFDERTPTEDELNSDRVVGHCERAVLRQPAQYPPESPCTYIGGRLYCFFSERSTSFEDLNQSKRCSEAGPVDVQGERELPAGVVCCLKTLFSH